MRKKNCLTANRSIVKQFFYRDKSGEEKNSLNRKNRSKAQKKTDRD